MLGPTQHVANTYYGNQHQQHHAPSTPRSTDRSMNSLRATNMNRSRSARNVMARTLPILERGGSTRNLRGLPADRRRQAPSALLESPASARGPGNFRQRRSNSTRRFFVADQNSRGSGSTASTSATANSLSHHFRRMALERTDSSSSMGSFQSWGNSTMCSASYNGSSGPSNNDSVLSILSIDSEFGGSNGTVPRAPPSVLSSGIDTDLDQTETDGEEQDMMSLFSKDSVKVRHNQLESSLNALTASCRDGMSVMADDMDMLSLASSECTVYSFDVVARPATMASALGPLTHHLNRHHGTTAPGPGWS